ncbi:MAG TPA: TIGR03560 family F420-dependent LLM class oxidoreductase, partial [Candidatus Binataceae bacterium]|nr:TIGR03560 family F420-dependent LLM class oxidoreductase [Candidatus Binataceae bacterium]
MPTHPIRFGIQTGQQDCTWEQMRDFWQKVDAWGYDSLWAFDHFYPIFVPDPHGPCMENWTLLSALSQHTKHARIGALVNGNTYRNPALTAKMAATLDNICGGRLNLGLGSGWFELEHNSLGFDFKTIPQRLEALEESCRIIKGMFTDAKTTLRGKHYTVVDAVCNPKPVQQNMPLMIGGHGERVLLKIVAQYADMWNMTNAAAAEMRRLIGVIERHADTVGRDADKVEKTLMLAMSYN